MTYSELIDRIIKETRDEKSLPFWEKAVRELGEDHVSAALTDLKCTMLSQEVKEPAKYLAAMLKQEITSGKQPDKMKKTPYPESEGSFLTTLKRAENDERPTGTDNKLTPGYSGKYIPFPTFIGSEFFTLSTVKEKSDCVLYALRTQEGKSIPMKLYRGKNSPNAKKSFGIPTVQHWRVFAALKVAWAEKGCRYIEREGGECLCVLNITAKELAKILGWDTWQSLSGTNTEWLRSMVYDLKVMPYCLQVENINSKQSKDYDFSLLYGVETQHEKSRGGESTLFKVTFSSPVSYSLLERKAVSRSLEMLHVKSELSTLLWIYLEPALRANKESFVGLSSLIDILQLPPAGWQNYKSTRKRTFKSAIKELQDRQLIDGHDVHLEIVEGLNDYVLNSTLKTKQKDNPPNSV